MPTSHICNELEAAKSARFGLKATVDTWGSILAVGGTALLVGAVVNGAPRGRVRGHGLCGVLGAKLGAALHEGGES